MTHSSADQKSYYWRWFLLSIGIIACDQISKYVILHTMVPYHAHAVLPFFNITLVYNTGAAFNFLSGYPQLSFWLFGAIAVMMSVVLMVWIKRLPMGQPVLACALALVLGGAVGNLIDRFVHGHVIDFLDFYYHYWHFPAFNIADSAISIGAGLLVIHLLFFGRS